MIPISSMISNPPPCFPDVGLGYIAAAIKKSGHDVHIRCWNMNPSVESFKRDIEKNKFGLVGIKVFTKDVLAANKTIRIIKSMSPDTIIVTGGPHPSTSEPEDIMIDFPESDFAIRGDAELGLPLLIKYIGESGKKHAEDLKKIPGLVWKNGNTIQSNKPFFSSDLDKFGMPLWELMDPKDYNSPKFPSGDKTGYSAPIIVTRGCPSTCTYCCAHKVNSKNVRSRSAAAVLEEISYLYNNYHVRHLFFQDTRFAHHIEKVTEICKGILKRKMDIAWDCVGYESVDTLTKDVLKLMKSSGCKFINIGIETGSDRVRRRIKKKGTTKEIFEKVKMIKDSGIGVRAWFMIGFPEETKKDIENTVSYAFSLPANFLSFEIPYPLPGTELYKYLRGKYNVNRINWENFDVYKSPYPLSELSSSELRRLLRKIRLHYRFVSLKRRLLSMWR